MDVEVGFVGVEADAGGGIDIDGWGGGEGAERVGSADGEVCASVVRAMAAAEAGGSGESENEGTLPFGFAATALGVVGDSGDALAAPLGLCIVTGGGGGGMAALSVVAVVGDTGVGDDDDDASSLASSTTLNSGAEGRAVVGGCWIRGSPRHRARKVCIKGGFQMTA